MGHRVLVHIAAQIDVANVGNTLLYAQIVCMGAHPLRKGVACMQVGILLEQDPAFI